ncbi:hypothetical protein KC357_g19 [Hortaea werneckii]|nr:hypothetical protein KC357_g19 [Hortaea werneckii]
MEAAGAALDAPALHLHLYLTCSCTSREMGELQKRQARQAGKVVAANAKECSDVNESNTFVAGQSSGSAVRMPRAGLQEEEPQ